MEVNTCNNFSKDIQEWAYINFQLQIMLCQNTPSISNTMKKELDIIGYKGICLDKLNNVQKEELIGIDSFFGHLQTGNRIIAFALKKSGLNRDIFNDIQDSIGAAYEDVVQKNGRHELVETSYQNSLQTLSVFRP